MNKLLQISKKWLLAILLSTVLVFIITIILNNDKNSLNESSKRSDQPNFDIINPSFTINNEKKISVKAERGNFISDKKILLEKNVIFKSLDFELQTPKAIYNKSNQSAKSVDISRFESKGTVIVSEGFEVNENGNIIFFNGKTKLNLNKSINQ